MEQLKKQKTEVGGCAILDRAGAFLYYLVTKPKYNDKPTLETLRQSCTRMRDHCVENGVRLLAMPRIGCGLDRLRWEDVKDVLVEVFRETRVRIVVYSL